MSKRTHMHTKTEKERLIQCLFVLTNEMFMIVLCLCTRLNVKTCCMPLIHDFFVHVFNCIYNIYVFVNNFL